jgi:hypothetical protein
MRRAAPRRVTPANLPSQGRGSMAVLPSDGSTQPADRRSTVYELRSSD